MIRLRLSCIKENFLWMPLLLVAISNCIYLALIGFSFLMGLIQTDLMTIITKDLFDIIIMIGWGFLVISVLNGIGLMVGLLTAIFAKKPLKVIWKKRIRWFLLFFYISMGGAFVFQTMIR